MTTSAEQNDAITIRQITSDDWRAYRDFYKGLSSPQNFRGIMQGQNLDIPETYKHLPDKNIATGSFVMFGLWQGATMIGQSAIDITVTDGDKKATLAGSEIADAYRKRGLADRFYAARMQYLADIGFDGEITTEIKPDNIASRKAAERNGFVDTGKFNKAGSIIYVPGTSLPQEAAPALLPQTTKATSLDDLHKRMTMLVEGVPTGTGQKSSAQSVVSTRTAFKPPPI
jgi:hypothetical protein